MLQIVSCRPFSAKILLRRMKPWLEMPVGVAEDEEGEVREIRDLISERSSGERGRRKHFCWKSWISLSLRRPS
jgi:hypothetical protein